MFELIIIIIMTQPLHQLVSGPRGGDQALTLSLDPRVHTLNIIYTTQKHSLAPDGTCGRMDVGDSWGWVNYLNEADNLIFINLMIISVNEAPEILL